MATRLPAELLNLVIDYAVPPPTQQGGPAHHKACEQLSLVHRTRTRQAQRQLYSTFYGSWPRPDPPYELEDAEVRDLVKWRKERSLAWVEQAGRLSVESWSAVLRIRAESPSYRGKKHPDRGIEYDWLEFALPPAVLREVRAVLVDADSHAYGFNELNPDDYCEASIQTRCANCADFQVLQPPSSRFPSTPARFRERCHLSGHLTSHAWS